MLTSDISKFDCLLSSAAMYLNLISNIFCLASHVCLYGSMIFKAEVLRNTLAFKYVFPYKHCISRVFYTNVVEDFLEFCSVLNPLLSPSPFPLHPNTHNLHAQLQNVYKIKVWSLQ